MGNLHVGLFSLSHFIGIKVTNVWVKEKYLFDMYKFIESPIKSYKIGTYREHFSKQSEKLSKAMVRQS